MSGPRSRGDEVRRPHGTMIICMTSTRERWSLPQLCTTPDLLFMNHVTRSGMFIHFLVCHASINVIIIGKRIMLMMVVFEGSLEVKLPTIWTDEKQGREEAERRERLEERRVEEKE